MKTPSSVAVIRWWAIRYSETAIRSPLWCKAAIVRNLFRRFCLCHAIAINRKTRVSRNLQSVKSPTGSTIWALLAATSLATLSAPAAATTLSGLATVVDGDSLVIAGKRIRLFGIDAPEATQTCDRDGQTWACGQAAIRHLTGLIGGEPVTCSGSEVDQYGRLLAVCTVAGAHLNQTMVADGWATAFHQYSEAYALDETRARAAKLGLWTSNFEAPADYRAEQRQAAAPRARVAKASRAAGRPSGGCWIKGNRNRRGEWIYHLRGTPYYDETRAEEMFCSEAQAQAAGYRPSRAQ